MSSPGIPTIDQLNVLVHIADGGSFTNAARKMRRAPSVISYAITNLEAHLGVKLFDREASRRPCLTPEGQVVLSEARLIVAGVSGLRARVAAMMTGLESDLHIVLDALLPPARMIDALSSFQVAFPTVRLHIHVETLGAVANMVLEGKARVGVAGPYADYAELAHISVGRFCMAPVAARDHPLARSEDEGHAPGAARTHVQLVVYDRSPLTEGKDFSVAACRTWRMSDLSAKLTLLRAGIGWGMMPLAMVEDDLASGALVQLDLPDQPPFDYPVDAIYRTDAPPGPAATWLIERFKSQSGAQH